MCVCGCVCMSVYVYLCVSVSVYMCVLNAGVSFFVNLSLVRHVPYLALTLTRRRACIVGTLRP